MLIHISFLRSKFFHSALDVFIYWCIKSSKHFQSCIYICVQLFAKILSPSYISEYKYIEYIVGRVPLEHLLPSQCNVSKHVIYSIYWARISSYGYMLMNFCTQGRFLKWKPSHNALHICIYWCISRALNFCKQLYITYNIYWMPRCSNACKPLARAKYSHSLVHFYLLLANCLCASLLLMSLSSYLACYFYDTVALTVANTLKCIFL